MAAAGDGADGRRLKLATRELVRACGGIECAAADLGKGKSTVHRWTDPHDGEHLINIGDVALLEAVAAAPVVTAQLARMAGGVFVPLPDCAADPETLAGMVLELTGQLGAISTEMRASLADDGEVDAKEAAALLALVEQHDAIAAQLRLTLRAIVEAGN